MQYTDVRVPYFKSEVATGEPPKVKLKLKETKWLAIFKEKFSKGKFE